MSERGTPRAVLVTGGAKRLGAAFVRALAAGGWRPVIHYGSSQDAADALAEETGGVTVQADLADARAVRGLVAAASDAAGAPLTGLVNSASVFEHDTIEDVTLAATKHHHAVNAAAPVLLARRFAEQAPEPAAGGGAAIVNVLDQKLWNPNPDHLSYTMSKAALAEATRLLAQGLGPRVRVMGVAPGYCLPNPTESDEAFAARAPSVNLIKARLQPEDVAACVRFALECPALTGSVLMADGGEHLVPKARDVVFT